MKILRVGDPHVTVSNISSSEKLFDFVFETAKKYKVDKIELLGDLFHTHAVKRLEVEHFWQENVFKRAAKEMIPMIVLVGNHDKIGSKEKEYLTSALSVFKDYEYITIVEDTMAEDGIGYVSYTSNQEQFLNKAGELYKIAPKCLVAHQTFTGATYENGFYAEDGIDPELVLQDNLISGHIHKTQQIGKCFYPGTPKWDTISDANENKGIWIFEHEADGSLISKTLIETKDVVQPIKKYTITEGEKLPELNDKDRNYLELIGSSAWTSKVKKQFKGLAAIKTRITDRKQIKIERNKTSDIKTFLNEVFQPIDGVTKQDLENYLMELV